jgi:SAM-dependent methyltransferase
MSNHAVSEDQFHFFKWQNVTIDNFEVEGHILDIGGGGEGIIGRLKGEQIIAIDPSARELAEAPVGPLKIIMDARDLKFLDRSFTTVTSFFTLLYIQESDHRKVFEEVYRVLTPGGEFRIWDGILPGRQKESKDFVAFRLKIKLPGAEIETGYGIKWPEKRQDKPYYLQIAEESGFSVMDKTEEKQLFCLRLRKQ